MPNSLYSQASNPKKGFIQNMGKLQMADPIKSKLEGTFDVFKQSPSSATAPVKASPAKQQFIQSQMQEPVSQINQQMTPPPGTANGMVQQSTPDPKDSYRSAFNQYIESLKPSNEETQARKYLSDLTLQSKRDQEEALNRGETLGFAAGEAQRVNRNNAFALEGAASAVDALTGSRTAMTEAQKARLAFEKDMMSSESEQNKPFELGEGQSRYEYDPVTKGYKQVASKGKTYAPGTGLGSTPGALGNDLGVSPAAKNIIDIINAGGGDVDTLIKGTSKEAQALRNEVYKGLAAQGGRPETTTALYKDGKEIVDDLLKTEGYKAMGGWSTRLGGQFGTAYGDAMAKAQMLGAILARDNLGLLKGAMSDKDLEFIKAMSTGFEGAGIQSEGYLKERLEAIQTKLANKIAQTSSGAAPAQSAPVPNKGVTPSGIGFQIIQD